MTRRSILQGLRRGHPRRSTTTPLHVAVDHPWIEGNHSNQGQTYGRHIGIEVRGFSNLPDTAPAAMRDRLATYGVKLTRDQRTQPNWDGVPLTHRFRVATRDGETPLPK